jgi:hypothetical protein
MNWLEIENFLHKELNNKLNQYFKIIHNETFCPEKNYDQPFQFLKFNNLYTDFFMIQKYDKNTGKYTCHVDELYFEDSHRVITFIWYLNTVEEGGETVFWNDSYKIKPERGKLLLFPSQWMYPHKGSIPISDSKYIITGWILIKN